MDHVGEAARPTTTGGEARVSTGTSFHGLLGAAVAPRRAGFDEFARRVHAAVERGEMPVAVFHREHAPGVAYASIGAYWRQPGPVGVVLVGLQLPDEAVQVNDSSFYSELQLRPGAGPGVVLADLLRGSVVYDGLGRGEVLVDVDLLPDDDGHGEVFDGQLPGGGVPAYDDYGYFALQARPGAGHGEVLVDLRTDGAGHGEVFVGLLPDGVDAVYDGIAGALRNPNLGAGYDGSGALADDLGAGYDHRGMAAERLHRLFAFVGMGASSVAVNGLATGPSSPAVAFHLFVLLLAGLFLVIMHVLLVQ